MKNLKVMFDKFKKYLGDIFTSKEVKKERDKTKYLSQFTKDYYDRNDAEKILIYCLYNLEFDRESKSMHNVARMYGSIEATLILEKFLKIAEEFEFEENETYGMHMIRKAKEYLKVNNCM